jgi:Uma2 family endonuclease
VIVDNEKLVAVEEYLHTSYEVEPEYVDGALVDRNVGSLPHSTVKGNVMFALAARCPRHSVLPSLTFQTAPTRYRIPDICVVLERLRTRFLHDAAYLVIEILADEDKISYMMEKLQEYQRKGVPNIWLFEPRLRAMFVYASEVLHEIVGDSIVTVGEPRVELTRDEVFQDLDPAG